MIHVTDTITIFERELHESFVRSPGPGGQNVNKVATAVQLRFDAGRSPALNEAVRARLARLAGRRMTAGGEIVIVARRFRSRERNRADARARLKALILRAATPPAPRRKTRPPAGSRKQRLVTKRRRGDTKRRRAPVKDADD